MKAIRKSSKSDGIATLLANFHSRLDLSVLILNPSAAMPTRGKAEFALTRVPAFQ